MSEVVLPRPIYVVSDGTGDTAEKVVRAALHQFQQYLVHVRVFPEVTEREQLERLARMAARDGAMMVTTLVNPAMRAAAQQLAKEHGIHTVDVIGQLLRQLSGFLEARPAGVPGRMYQADEQYFRRIEAVEFTVKADDGKEPRMLRGADIVLVGVSRTSKTPLSVFLAHKGYKVSNVPVVLDHALPRSLEAVDQRRVFALTIDPVELQQIRRTRMETLQFTGRNNYIDMDSILAELEFCEDLYRRNPMWPVIDVTRKAVEETAATILKIMSERGFDGVRGEAGQL